MERICSMLPMVTWVWTTTTTTISTAVPVSVAADITWPWEIWPKSWKKRSYYGKTILSTAKYLYTMEPRCRALAISSERKGGWSPIVEPYMWLAIPSDSYAYVWSCESFRSHHEYREHLSNFTQPWPSDFILKLCHHWQSMFDLSE